MINFFADFIDLGLSKFKHRFETLFSKGHPVSFVINQIGVDLHAQVTGDVYVWSQRYERKWYGVTDFDKPCGFHWVRVQEGDWPLIWSKKIALLSVVKNLSYFDEIDLKDWKDWDLLVQASLGLFKKVMDEVLEWAKNFMWMIMRVAKGEFEVVVYDGVVQGSYGVVK